MPEQLLPPLKIDCYHAGYTGKNLEYLQNFLKKGAVSNFNSNAIGQSGGFFVWTTKALALNHANNFLEDNSAYGYRMILKVTAPITPEDWDLDAEVHAKFILYFIHKNLDTIKKIPDNVLKTTLGTILPSQTELLIDQRRSLMVFRFHLMTSTGPMSVGVGFGRKNEEYFIGQAIIVSAILDYIQRQNPRQVFNFEKEIFNAFAKNGMALKYVGKIPLQLKDFEVFIDQKWRTGNESLQLLKEKGLVFA